tara:strand:+ start:3920 stop:4969 length:1050 start_codon:yes stop_codon:yes gene_type:complete
MKKIKDYATNTTRYILESVEDVESEFAELSPMTHLTDYTSTYGYYLANTLPLIKEVLVSGLGLVVSIRIRCEDGYKPKIIISPFDGVKTVMGTCAYLYHKEDLDTPLASIGFNTTNERYVLRNKGIKRGGEQRDYWDASLKESKSLKNIMKVLRSTLSTVTPTPHAFLEVLLSKCEAYREKAMGAYHDGHSITAIPHSELERMVDLGYEPNDPILKSMVANYKDNYTSYAEAKKYAPTTYHVRRVSDSDSVYIAKFQYPSWEDTAGSRYSNSYSIRNYLASNPMGQEQLYSEDKIPEHISGTTAVLDMQDSTSELKLSDCHCYLQGVGIKVNGNRYWIIDENKEVELDV